MCIRDSHGVVVTEVELIADTYFTGRIHQYIPQPVSYTHLELVQ